MSFYTSLTGLQGATSELSVISNNVANVGTNGFKRSRVEFGDIISTNSTLAPSKMIGSGTLVKSIRQQFGQGALQQTSSALDLSISGEGFFAVRPSMTTPGVTFTRNGAFTVNDERYVVDAQGSMLQVYPVDGSGNVVSAGIGSTKSLQLPMVSGDPIATTTVTQSINLPAGGNVIASDPKYTEANPYEFDRFDSSTYNNSNLVTVYDSFGNPMAATNYYVRTSAPTAENPTSSWNVYTFVGDQQISSDAANPSAPLQMTFNSQGTMTTPASAVAYAPFATATGSTQSLTFDYGNATTQGTGSFLVNGAEQDGLPVGQLDNVTVDSEGLVVASFSNGTTQALGKVVMATFDNPGGLKQLGNSTWAVSGLSGDPILGESGDGGFGTINSGSLEKANVDITEELVMLISAQRNFQANAKAIETANTLSSTIINMRS